MKNQQTLTNTIAFVKTHLQSAEGGHDWFHIERVYKNALLIAKGKALFRAAGRLTGRDPPHRSCQTNTFYKDF